MEAALQGGKKGEKQSKGHSATCQQQHIAHLQHAPARARGRRSSRTLAVSTPQLHVGTDDGEKGRYAGRLEVPNRWQTG